MITAVAAVVTAVGGLYLGFRGGGSEAVGGADDTDESDTTVPVDTSPEPVGTAEPPGPAPVDPSQLNLGRLNEVDTGDLGADVDRTIDDCANGSADACVVLLDQLTVECADGFGLSCDVLYLVSPVGSDYELFGETCGGLFAAPYDGYCADL